MAVLEIKYYNENKFLDEEYNGSETLLKDCLKIINTYENKKNREYNNFYFDKMLDEYRSEFYEAFTANKNGCAFIMYQNKKPISFCLFTNTDFDNDELHLEMIYTHKDYSGMGRAKMLLNHAFNTLANTTNVKTVISAVHKDNCSSISLHEAYLKNLKNNSNTKTYFSGERKFFEIDLNDFKNIELENELAK